MASATVKSEQRAKQNNCNEDETHKIDKIDNNFKQLSTCIKDYTTQIY